MRQRGFLLDSRRPAARPGHFPTFGSACERPDIPSAQPQLRKTAPKLAMQMLPVHVALALAADIDVDRDVDVDVALSDLISIDL